MNYNEILSAAKEFVGPNCKACPVCNGRACANTLPGPGSKAPGNVAARNYDKWQEVCVNMDTLCPRVDPDVSFELFGHKFAAPIFVAPLGAVDMHYGPKYNDISYNDLMVKAAAEYGLMALTGDGLNAEVLKRASAQMSNFGGMGCPTIKPWNKEAVFEKLDILNERGIFAAAMDIDAAGLPFLKAINPNAGAKTVEEIREICAYAKMPFILKGIMTVEGALKALEAGTAGIVVSNHGGRVQGGVPSTAEVLPAIAKAVKGKLSIFVDGGIRSGLDVFRALALGADAVLIGRPLAPVIYGGGEEGFKLYMDKIIAELKDTMTMCAAATLKDIDGSKLWKE
ncbi:MAG: alpha-hydroxy-acid oxidizing protein [Oscillospiraceae bacterium]|nr:alpha-hydroxy-acid oxidizing protein [Oscillospiraceae bacterium]